MFSVVLNLLEEGNVYILDRNYAQAQNCFDRAIQTASEIYKAAMQQQSVRRQEDCIFDDYQKIMFTANYKSGLVAYQLKDYSAALTFLQALLNNKYFPSIESKVKNDIYYYLAFSALKTNQNALAQYYLERINISLFKDGEVDKKLLVNFLRGNNQFARGFFRSAIIEYQQALSTLSLCPQKDFRITQELIQNGFKLFDRMIARQLYNQTHELENYLCDLLHLIKDLNMPLMLHAQLYSRTMIIRLQSQVFDVETLIGIMHELTKAMSCIPDDQKTEQAYILLGLALVNCQPIIQQPRVYPTVHEHLSAEEQGLFQFDLSPDDGQAAKGFCQAIKAAGDSSPLALYIEGLNSYQYIPAPGLTI